MSLPHGGFRARRSLLGALAALALCVSAPRLASAQSCASLRPAYDGCGQFADCGAPCCDPCGCASDCDVYCGCEDECDGCDSCCGGPLWYARAEALVLRINELDPDPLALNVATLAPELTVGSLNFPYEVGPRLTVGRYLDGGAALEASYFGLMQWSSSATAADANNLRLPGDLGLAGDDFFGADSITASQSTRLHNAEINYLQAVGDTNFKWLVGFRYVNFVERANLHSVDSDGEQSDYRVSARNNLFGGQIGARQDIFLDRLNINAVGKAGIFGNSQAAGTFVGDFDNSVVLRSVSDDQSRVAFVGEVGVNGAFFLTDWFAVRGGYNVYWLEGIARGTDQFDFTDTPASSTSVAGNGGAFLHGFNGGLELVW